MSPAFLMAVVPSFETVTVFVGNIRSIAVLMPSTLVR